MRALPSLPGCGAPATIRIEVYSSSPAGGAYGSLDATAYSCPTHAGAIEQMLYDAGLSPYRMAYRQLPGEAVPAVCGTLRQFDTLVEPAGDTDHNGEPADPEVASTCNLPEPTDADVAAFVALMRLPEPDGIRHPRWCVRGEVAPMHHSSLFQVGPSLSVQIHQPHNSDQPKIALLFGGVRQTVTVPLDTAAALARQLRTAVQTAAG